jgi:hypothetical protein
LVCVQRHTVARDLLKDTAVAEAAAELHDRIRQALDGRFFARAVDLCEIGLNQLPPQEEEQALRALLDTARRGLLPQLAPSVPPPPEFWRGTEALGRGRFSEARRWFEAALEVAPSSAEAHTHLGMALVACGEFEAGWQEFEWRQHLGWGERRQMVVPYWEGGPLPGGRLLLWDEQGHGDAIQFVRFAIPAARRAGAPVIFHGRPRLCRLFRSCPGIDEAIPRSDDFPKPSAHGSLMSLPAVLQSGDDAIADMVPYLAPEPPLVEIWRRRLAPLPRPRVGIVWQGNPGYAFDSGRSFPLTCLLPLLQRFAQQVTFVSLQKGFGEEQLAQLPPDLNVTRVGHALDCGDDGFVETAALIANLDLTISSDTAVAHLAGALGSPVWIVLGSGADWRWGQQPTETPFYPTARLFRRGQGEDWGPVGSRVAEALGRFIAGEEIAA